MKKLTTILIAVSMLVSFSLNATEDLREFQKETADLYRGGGGAEDGLYTAISASMIGWGLGLAAGIALLTGLLHQSHAEAHSD